MKIKMFESYSKESNLVDLIKRSRMVKCRSIKNLPNHDPNDPVKPVSIDENGLVTIEVDGSYYESELDNIEFLSQ